LYKGRGKKMEIVDAHVHIGKRHLPMEQVQSVLDDAGADRAVVFADPESSDIPGDNQYVLESVQGNNHIPFFYIGGNAYSTNRPFPQLPDPDVLEQYRGIKWHCWFTPGHDFGGIRLGMNKDQVREALTEPRMAALMDKVMDMGIPVNLEEHFDVTVLFADLYPEVMIIIPHMGGLNGGSERILSALGRKENVHFDVSLASLTSDVVKSYGAGKFICGSDYPYGNPSWSIDSVRKLNVSDEEREAIFSGNILSLTGLA
jgi:predicted TIM-barrel fold metal-dependent hydrolase